MQNFGAQKSVLANRVNNQLHKLAGWGVDDLGLLIELFTERLNELAHYEL